MRESEHKGENIEREREKRERASVWKKKKSKLFHLN
jgi:hypothetical protein